MSLTWSQRLEQQPLWWKFNRWPVISIDTVSKKYRKQFLRNKGILANALAGTPLKDVAHEYNISPGRVTQLLDRCLGGEEDAPPALTKGLIPYATVRQKKRQSELPTFVNQKACACAFQALLQEVPRLQEGLDEMILAKLKDTDYAQSVTPYSFFGAFKRILKEAHWPEDTYPYTSETLAYESVRCYLHQRRDELIIVRENKHKSYVTPKTSSRQYRALRTTQTDEHTLDMRDNVHLELNDELIPLALGCCSVLVTMDVDTSCALGFHIAHTVHPNQQDMLTHLDKCVQPWQPMTLTTPGLSYAKGACFPSGLDDAFPITFGTMQLDNALMHRANSVIDLICEKQGGTVSYGHPATPTIRALVESVFDYICKKVTHRFASTRGSHPRDPKKESRKNQKRIPTVSLRTVEEAISILLTEYNVTPRATLGYATPLALFRHHCQEHFVRYVPEQLRQQWQPLSSEQIVTLHWNKKEDRAPHINFMYERYQGSGLWKALPKDKKILIRFNRLNICSVLAFTLTGEDLGIIYAPRSWQRFPHSVAIRQKIHKLSKIYRFNERDPLGSYFQLLLEQKGNPKMALQLVRVYEEFRGDSPVLILNQTDTSISQSNALTTKNQPTWKSTTANHRR